MRNLDEQFAKVRRALDKVRDHTLDHVVRELELEAMVLIRCGYDADELVILEREGKRPCVLPESFVEGKDK